MDAEDDGIRFIEWNWPIKFVSEPIEVVDFRSDRGLIECAPPSAAEITGE
jgi:hypothetical protein